MNIKYNTRILIAFIALMLVGLSSCEDFFDPEVSVVVKQEDMYRNWSDFRAAEMGLYSVQQELVEQLVVLGELRADLLEVTSNADPELREIYNYNFYEGNSFISPVNFYKLIVNSNYLMKNLKALHPAIGNPDLMKEMNSDQDPDNNLSPDNRYNKMFASALCMRAWAYFNAVKIYGEIPYVPYQITELAQIDEYLASGAIIPAHRELIFNPDGTSEIGDSIPADTLEAVWLNTDAIIDTFTYQLNEYISKNKDGIYTTDYVGVDYNSSDLDSPDPTWEITVWNEYAYNTLLGIMYFTKGDLYSAETHFNEIVYNRDQNSSLRDRYLLTTNSYTSYFGGGTSTSEHIYAISFSKSERQQNDLQRIFDNQGTNQHMLKPTDWAIWLWETDWIRWNKLAGTPGREVPVGTFLGNGNGNKEGAYYIGDFIRGNGLSYVYEVDGRYLNDSTVLKLSKLKVNRNTFEAKAFMLDADTMVYKFTKGKQEFDRDAFFPVYRAGGVHLWMAELLNRLKPVGTVNNRNTATNIINNGDYEDPEVTYTQNKKGVRGRVGRNDNLQMTHLGTIYDPFTCEFQSWSSVTDLENDEEGIDRFEDYIIDEQGRETAYEGERFYTLMRVAERRKKLYGDAVGKAYLADRVARKFSADKEEAYSNWVKRNNNEKGKALIGDRALQMKKYLEQDGDVGAGTHPWYVPFYVGAFSNLEETTEE